MNNTSLKYSLGKELRLAANLSELKVLDPQNNYGEIVSTVSKKELIEKLSKFNTNFFEKHQAFIMDYINNHIKFSKQNRRISVNE